MKERNAYIVDEIRFSILQDMIDFDDPILEENENHKLDGRFSYYFRGRKTSFFPEGRLYHVENCFKTRELAEDKLVEVMRSEIENNEILMKNLSTENCKLYEKIQNIHDRRHKETNE